MRLYFKNRNSPKAYKVVITALNNSHLGFIGEITNPTMKIGNGVVQFYLAPIASQGTWTIDEDYHFNNGKLTLMAFKNLTHTSYNSHATYSDFTKNIQLALELTEFHGFEIIGIVVKEITSLSDASWMYDAENKKILYYNSNTSGSLTLNQVASGINTSLISQNTTTKSKAELFIKEVIKDLFRTQPKGLLKASEFNSAFITNAVLTVLGTKIYSDTDVNKYTTSSLNFSQGLIDRIPDVVWNTEGNATVVSGGEAFSHTALQTTGALGDALKTSNKLISGGSKPFTVSFDFLIKEDQIKANAWPYLSLFSKSTNIAYGDQFLYVRGDLGYKLCFQRSTGVGGNVIQEVVGNRRIEYNTKYTVKITYDGNMFKCFLNDVLDFKFGTTVGWFADSDQPYRLLDNLVPNYPAIGTRAFTNGYIDNVQVDDGISRDHTIVNDPYLDSLVSKLSFQGQADKTVFVDEAKATSTWTGYGDAKLVVEDTLSNYSYLNLNGMSSYLLLNNADHLAFTGSKFSIRMTFKTSTKRDQCLLDRYQTGNKGGYQIFVNTAGNIDFYYVPVSSYSIFKSSASNLNDGVKHTIDIIKEGNSLLIYIDNVLDSMHDVTGITFNFKVPKTTIGAQVQTRNDSYDFNGQIYEFIAYDGVSVYPNIVVKNLNTIQLDFNKNQIQDTIGNSTWTNTGITLDRDKSLDGYSAVYSGAANKLQTNSNIFNFGTGNFYTEANLKMDKPVTGQYRYYLTTANTPQDTGAVWYHASGSILGVDYNPRPTGYGLMSYNYVTSDCFYNHKVVRQNNVIHNIVNDVVCNTAIHDLDINLNKNNITTLGIHPAFEYSNRASFKGALDDFKVIKDYQANPIVDKPAIHLPLNNSFVNIGYSTIVSNAIGNPSYAVKDDKKCITFTSGKYITIDHTNILSCGKNSDFYLSFDFFHDSVSSDNGGYPAYFANQRTYNVGAFWIGLYSDLKITCASYTSSNIDRYDTSNQIIMQSWNTLKISKKDLVLTLDLNGTVTTYNILPTTTFNFSENGSYIGTANLTGLTNNSVKGYMSNFKLFVGTSSPSKNYNDKQVLDLDFKPTYKSYFFKDNYNNCVINPINLLFRHYENNQYCLKLNGVDQYLYLGKNNLFNFGFDDFVIKIKASFKTLTKNFNMLMNGYHDGLSSSRRPYFGVCGINHPTAELRGRAYFDISNDSPNVPQISSDTVIDVNKIYEFVLCCKNKIVSLEIDGVLQSKTFVLEGTGLNFSEGLGTYFGVNATESGMSLQESYMDGTFYHIRVLRNTSDTSLLYDVLPEPESPEDGNDTGIPPLEKGVLNFWQLRQDVDPHNLVLEFNQLRLE